MYGHNFMAARAEKAVCRFISAAADGEDGLVAVALGALAADDGIDLDVCAAYAPERVVDLLARLLVGEDRDGRGVEAALVRVADERGDLGFGLAGYVDAAHLDAGIGLAVVQAEIEQRTAADDDDGDEGDEHGAAAYAQRYERADEKHDAASDGGKDGRERAEDRLEDPLRSAG